MPEPDLVQIFAAPLHQSGARYLVAGSVGAMIYSEPRLTIDIDLAVALGEETLATLPSLFPEPDFYCPPAAVLQFENRRECRAHFNVVHVPTGLKADFYPSQNDPFFAWAWEHRKTATHTHGEIHYAPPEYVMVWKTVYHAEGGGEKHVRDIRRMLEISADLVDKETLSQELRRRGLLEHFRTMSENSNFV
ncbi:MAG: hypothetical protein ACKOJB_02155 [Chthoniobacterales bacterium]